MRTVLHIDCRKDYKAHHARLYTIIVLAYATLQRQSPILICCLVPSAMSVNLAFANEAFAKVLANVAEWICGWTAFPGAAADL